jgi:hypothetical protein
MAGFVYIMSNPSFVSGRIKIGKSDRDPEEFRKPELDGTAIPEPFEVEYYAFVDDHDELERTLHETFNYARVNKSREFFDVPIEEVIEEIKRIAQIKFEVNNYIEETEEEASQQEPYVREERSISSIKEVREEAPQREIYSRTRYGSYVCEECSTPFSVTVVRGESHTRCPECLQLNWA